MSLQPTDLPRWADDPAADVVAPLSGTQDTGYAEGEQPPAPEVNWLFRSLWYWIEWLANRTAAFIPATIYDAMNFAVTINGGDAPEIALRSSGAGACTVDLTPHINDGEYLSDVTLRVKGDGAVDCTFDVILVPVDGTAPSTLGTLTANNVSATNGAQTITVGDSIDLDTGSIVLLITANATGFALYHVALHFTPAP